MKTKKGLGWPLLVGGEYCERGQCVRFGKRRAIPVAGLIEMKGTKWDGGSGLMPLVTIELRTPVNGGNV